MYVSGIEELPYPAAVEGGVAGPRMQSNTMPVEDIIALDHPRVLVVEDEFLIRMLIADHLRDAGFTVIEAFNGDEAIALLTAGVVFDLVFTDVRMPGSADGMALLGFIQRTRPDLPVLITSGHLEPELAVAGGARRFLAKPCDPDFVVAAIRAALDAAA